MKFIAMIASAILIALVSQHSIMGLPLNNTLACSQGMKLIDGRCVSISSLNTSNGQENSSPVTDIFPLRLEATSTTLMPARNDDSCPQGMKHGKYGICEDIQNSTNSVVDLPTTTAFLNQPTTEYVTVSTTTQLNTPSSTTQLNTPSSTTQLNTPSSTTQLNTPSTTTQLNTPSTTPKANAEATTKFVDVSTTTALNTPSTPRFKGKSGSLQTTVGTPSDYDELSTTTELNTPSTRKVKATSTKLPTTTQTASDYDELSTTTELNTPSTRKVKAKSTTLPTTTRTSSDYDELTTTTERDENVGGVADVKGCPKGTQRDDDGACVSTQPMNSTKATTDPKALLKDGLCPTDYKMIDGRCLFIKPKSNSTSYQTGALPKSGVNSQSEDGLVPVLADNSCPEGTEYSAFGLCRKRVYATTPRLFTTNKSQSSRPKSTRGVISTTTPSEEES